MTGFERLRRELGAIEGETDDATAARAADMIRFQRQNTGRLRRSLCRALSLCERAAEELSSSIMDDEEDEEDEEA